MHVRIEANRSSYTIFVWRDASTCDTFAPLTLSAVIYRRGKPWLVCWRLKRSNNGLPLLINVAANYRDDHSALPRQSGSMPILSLRETCKSLQANRRMSMNISHVVGRCLIIYGQCLHTRSIAIYASRGYTRNLQRRYMYVYVISTMIYGCSQRENLPQQSRFLGRGCGRHPVSFPRTK